MLFSLFFQQIRKKEEPDLPELLAAFWCFTTYRVHSTAMGTRYVMQQINVGKRKELDPSHVACQLPPKAEIGKKADPCHAAFR